MDQVFLLSAKGRGFSFLDFERNKDRALFYERIRKMFFLLSAKGSRFSFGRQKKQKRQGEFSEFPPAPQNSSYPHKRKERRKVIVRPLIKGGKRETSTSGRVRWEQVRVKGRRGDHKQRRVVLQLRRGAGNRSARVLILT